MKCRCRICSRSASCETMVLFWQSEVNFYFSSHLSVHMVCMSVSISRHNYISDSVLMENRCSFFLFTISYHWFNLFLPFLPSTPPPHFLWFDVRRPTFQHSDRIPHILHKEKVEQLRICFYEAACIRLERTCSQVWVILSIIHISNIHHSCLIKRMCVCVCVWERESMYTETILEFIFTTFSENAFYVRHFKINIEFLLF